MCITANSDSERIKGPKMGCTHCTKSSKDGGGWLVVSRWMTGTRGAIAINCAVVLSVVVIRVDGVF